VDGSAALSVAHILSAARYKAQNAPRIPPLMMTTDLQ